MYGFKLSYTGRVGLHGVAIGEIGFSYYGGAYNTTVVEEVESDRSRNLSIATADFQTYLEKISIREEVTYAEVDVFEGLRQLFGRHQLGLSLGGQAILL